MIIAGWVTAVAAVLFPGLGVVFYIGALVARVGNLELSLGRLHVEVANVRLLVETSLAKKP